MITLLLASLSFKRFTEVAKPEPIAVPFFKILLYSISFKALETIALSLVIGVLVKLSPAKSTNPILSFGRFSTNSIPTSFTASNLFGLKSRASILAERSIAITISIPRTLLLCVVTSTVLGLAMATISSASASNRSIKSTGFNFAKIEVLTLKPFTLEILSSADWCLRFQKYQAITGSSRSNNQKNPGFSNV